MGGQSTAPCGRRRLLVSLRKRQSHLQLHLQLVALALQTATQRAMVAVMEEVMVVAMVAVGISCQQLLSALSLSLRHLSQSIVYVDRWSVCLPRCVFQCSFLSKMGRCLRRCSFPHHPPYSGERILVSFRSYHSVARDM